MMPVPYTFTTPTMARGVTGMQTDDIYARLYVYIYLNTTRSARARR